ncbi:MAG: hypothetical protein GY705_23495 [Bacteroidetes bacterium]|nr:hypothetical protein [Bacteroidota bacterium]
MAQDFFTAFGNDGFGVVGNDTTLTGSDVAGINMIAIKGLEERTVELNAVIENLLAKNKAQDEIIQEQQKEIDVLNTKVNEMDVLKVANEKQQAEIENIKAMLGMNNQIVKNK